MYEIRAGSALGTALCQPARPQPACSAINSSHFSEGKTLTLNPVAFVAHRRKRIKIKCVTVSPSPQIHVGKGRQRIAERHYGKGEENFCFLCFIVFFQYFTVTLIILGDSSPSLTKNYLTRLVDFSLLCVLDPSISNVNVLSKPYFLWLFSS